MIKRQSSDADGLSGEDTRTVLQVGGVDGISGQVQPGDARSPAAILLINQNGEQMSAPPEAQVFGFISRLFLSVRFVRLCRTQLSLDPFTDPVVESVDKRASQEARLGKEPHDGQASLPELSPRARTAEQLPNQGDALQILSRPGGRPRPVTAGASCTER